MAKNILLALLVVVLVSCDNSMPDFCHHTQKDDTHGFAGFAKYCDKTYSS